MTSYKLAQKGYGHPESPARSPRSVEYDLLAKCTIKLRSAWANRESDIVSLVQALSDNNRVWSVLAINVASPENSLPASLRAQLFYLYEFVALQSQRIRQKEAEIDVLIDINMLVMKGLRGQSEVSS